MPLSTAKSPLSQGRWPGLRTRALTSGRKLRKLESPVGDPVTVPELLEYIREVVREFALQRILESQPGGVDAGTRSWTCNHRVHFDGAGKLAQGVGVD